jgi:hypothetical protein
MSPSTAAGLAQLLSLGLYAIIARLYVVPRLKSRNRADALIPLVVLLVGETVTFVATLIRARGHEATATVATGINWLIQSFYVPLVPVTLSLIVWQIGSRRGESLAAEGNRFHSAQEI